MTCFSRDYSSERIIGKGSFAKVILCKRNSDFKEFAVKVFDKGKIRAAKNSENVVV